MNLSLRYTLISLLIVLALGGGWYVLHGKGVLSLGGTQAPSAAPALDPLLAAQAANSAGLSQAAAVAASTTASETFPNVYQNTTYGFSFHYPSTLKVGESTAGDGATTILAQDVAEHIGFQVYITPFTDPDPVITAARVAESLPNLTIEAAQQAQLSSSSEGVTFLTKDPSFGESRQVWVVYKQHLYQISTYSSQDALLKKVLATWVFAK